MKARLARFLLVPAVAAVLSLGLFSNVFAAYGTGNYGACTYQSQTDCAATQNGAGAPDTGQAAVSLLWPAIAGFVGFLLVSFVVIRYLNRNRGAQT